jgi:cytochrome c
MLEKSKKEAKKFVVTAINFYKNSGKDIALAEFTNPKGPFVHDESYIFVLNAEGTMLSHGVNEKYISKNFIDLKDSDGKGFIREIINSAQEKGGGYVEYKWYNPITKATKPKSVYFEKVDELIFCGGIYIEKWLDFISYNLRTSPKSATMHS